MIKSVQSINEEQLNQLLLLNTECRTIDGAAIPLYPHLITKQRPLPESLLYYHQHQLIGAAFAFFFEPITAEISLCVHPDHRLQGIGSLLFHRLLNGIQQYRMVTSLLISTPAQPSNPKLTSPWVYEHSEYQLSLSLNHYPIQQIKKSDAVSIRKAQPSDHEALCTIQMRCFNEINPIALNDTLNTPEKILWVASKNDQVIGQALLSSTPSNHVILSDLAVHPDHQHQGVGRKLLTACINASINTHHQAIILDVKSDNKTAIDLYQSFGFITTNAIDYWRFTDYAFF